MEDSLGVGGGVVIIGLVLRIVNLSPLKIYPDSYQNLLVANNLAEGGQVVGTLGEEGMVYPDYLAWTRPVTPILINFAKALGGDKDRSAMGLVLVNGLLGIIASSLIIRIVFKSKWAGITGALLTAISFDHIAWGGFILTETTGVLVQLILLGLLFVNLKKKVKTAEVVDLMTGAALAIGVLTRYEYLILLIPVVFIVVCESPNYITKLVNIMAAMLFVLALALRLLFPAFPWLELVGQTIDSFKTIGVAAGVLLAAGIVVRAKRIIDKVFLVTVWGVTALLPFWTQLDGLKNFVIYNFSLSILFLIGITAMLRSQKWKNWAYFCLLAIFTLGPVYTQMNHEMQRYWTHLLPYFLIPAVYAVNSVEIPVIGDHRLKQKALFLMLLIQIILSARGIKW